MSKPEEKLTRWSFGKGLIANARVAGAKVDDAMVAQMMAGHANRIRDMKSLVAQYKADQRIFIRVEDGARKGSIARLENQAITLMQSYHGNRPNRQVLHQSVWCGDYLVTLDKGDRYDPFYNLYVYLREYLEFKSEYLLDFDDRKPVKPSSAYLDITYLPGYQGPTDFQFTKTVLTEAQKLLVKNPYAFTPLDCFGHEVHLGDMVVYARADELIFGRLTKVSRGGIMTVDLIMNKGEARLMANLTVRCVKNGDKIPSLMRFSKDENLSQKLMVEKLRG